MKMPEPTAWMDDAASQGKVGNVSTTAAKRYWEKSDWVDRKNAERLKHPLYDKQALIDLLEEAAQKCEEISETRGDADECAAELRKLKETL